MYTPANPTFFLSKVRFEGVLIEWICHFNGKQT